jgi:hypothetical protein
MRKKHGFTPKYPDVQASTATMNILKVPLQMELRFHSRGYEQPPHRMACGTANSGWLTGDRCTNSAATTSAWGG